MDSAGGRAILQHPYDHLVQDQRRQQERAKELQCLFGVSKAILHSDTEVELLQDVVGLMPAGWSFPEFTRARIKFDGREFLSQPFSQNQCYQSAAITVGGIQRGLVEVYYVGNHPLLVTDSKEMAEGRHLVPEQQLGLWC